MSSSRIDNSGQYESKGSQWIGNTFSTNGGDVHFHTAEASRDTRDGSHSLLSQMEVDCLRCLYTTDYESHKDRNLSRAEGTCEWLLQHEQYSRWLRQRSSFLWISADAGCGKSVMASFLVDHFKSKPTQTNANEVVCHFFFKDDNELQRSADSALCALLHQLFMARNHLIEYAMPNYVSKKNAFTTEFGTLWRIFLAATTESTSLTTIVILDGLDECEQATRTQLMTSLVEFFADPRLNEAEGPCLKVVVTSRPHTTIERAFRSLQQSRIKVEDEAIVANEDIERVIRTRLQTIGSVRSLSDSLRNNLENRIAKNADHTFLWVALVLNRIERSARVSKKALEEAILEMPPTLKTFYSSILRGSPDPKEAQRIIRILVAAVRPFTLDEMNVVLCINCQIKNYDELDLEPDVAGTLKDICGDLIKIRNSTVYLVHQTAREFFQQEDSLIFEDSMRTIPGTVSSLHIELSHAELLEVCVAYLLFDVFNRRLPLEAELVLTRKDEEIIDEYVTEYCLLEYAARYWNLHFKQSNIIAGHSLWESILTLSDSSSMQFASWFNVYWRYECEFNVFPRTLNILSVASFFGHETLALWSLDHGSRADEVGHEGRMAIHWAAENGHTKIVRLLLDHESPMEETCKWGGTPLMLGAGNGHDSIVRLFLQHGASVNCSYVGGRTPLQCASLSAHPKVVRTLLQAGADCNSRFHGGRTPLHWVTTPRASGTYQAAIEVMRMLLKAGARVDAVTADGSTVLHDAASSASAESVGMVRELIEAGADVSARTIDGRTALDIALKYKWVSIAIIQALRDAERRQLS